MDFLNIGNRLRNVFAPKNPIIMDDPRNGGITGRQFPMSNPPRENLPLWPLPNIRQGHGVALDDNNDEDMISRIYSPQHEYSDLYRRTLDEMPQREEPGKLRRVFGVMAGLGQNGPQNQDYVKYGGYYRKLGDWDTRMKAIQPGMSAERYENSNERMLLNNILADETRRRGQDITDSKNREAARQKDEEIEIRRGRAEAYQKNLEFKQNHPKHELKAVPGGNYVWFNPEDPSEDPIDTGVKTGTLSKLEEINLGQKNALTRIAAQGNEARKTADTRGDIESGLIKERGAQARSTKAAPSDTSSETVSETEVVAKDEQGNPTKIKRRTTKQPLSKEVFHRMQYIDRNTGKPMTVRVPESKMKEAIQHGAKDLGVIK